MKGTIQDSLPRQGSNRQADDTHTRGHRRSLLAGAFMGLLICASPLLLATFFSAELAAYGGERGVLLLIAILVLISMAAMFTAIHGYRIISALIDKLDQDAEVQTGLPEPHH